ncbi:PapI protein [Escherichia coli]|nr:PapI protein [Escherichia coli]
MLPSETMIWQPEFTDKTLSRKPGAVQAIEYGKSQGVKVTVTQVK